MIKLKKKDHIHWDNFTNYHSKKVVNYITMLIDLGEYVKKEEFIETYMNLTSSKGPDSVKKHNGKRLFYFLENKAKWINNK